MVERNDPQSAITELFNETIATKDAEGLIGINNPDWPRPAMACSAIEPIINVVMRGLMPPESLDNFYACVIQAMYIAGYQRGKEDAALAAMMGDEAQTTSAPSQ
jgi:hypothetical protein